VKPHFKVPSSARVTRNGVGVTFSDSYVISIRRLLSE